MKMIRNIAIIALVAAFATGCASVSTEKWQNCALAGAAMGGAAGGLGDDHDSEDAIVSAIGGAIIGGTICALMADDEPAAVAEKPALDTDGDGVIDSLDECPKTPAGTAVDSKGCALDSDNDGVADYKDQCPNTAAGATVDALGCNRPLVLKGVTFEHNSAELTREAKIVLNRVAAIQKTYHAGVELEVAGHTNSLGSDAYNLDLSQRRADSVRAYMVSRGVESNELSAKGYGEADPVADNATKVGQAANRRVELRTK